MLILFIEKQKNSLDSVSKMLKYMRKRAQLKWELSRYDRLDKQSPAESKRSHLTLSLLNAHLGAIWRLKFSRNSQHMYGRQSFPLRPK